MLVIVAGTVPAAVAAALISNVVPLTSIEEIVAFVGIPAPDIAIPTTKPAVEAVVTTRSVPDATFVVTEAKLVPASRFAAVSTSV